MAVFIDSSSRSGKSILQIHFHRINSGMRRRSGGTRDARTAPHAATCPRRAVRVQRVPPWQPAHGIDSRMRRRSGGTRDARTALHYVHGNPVKHGLVREATEWPFSSIHRSVENTRRVEDRVQSAARASRVPPYASQVERDRRAGRTGPVGRVEPGNGESRR
jgi:hypothetical protein